MLYGGSQYTMSARSPFMSFCTSSPSVESPTSSRCLPSSQISPVLTFGVIISLSAFSKLKSSSTTSTSSNKLWSSSSPKPTSRSRFISNSLRSSSFQEPVFLLRRRFNSRSSSSEISREGIIHSTSLMPRSAYTVTRCSPPIIVLAREPMLRTIGTTVPNSCTDFSKSLRSFSLNLRGLYPFLIKSPSLKVAGDQVIFFFHGVNFRRGSN